MVSYANRHVAGLLPPEHYERIPRVVSGDEPSLPVWFEPMYLTVKDHLEELSSRLESFPQKRQEFP
jgi:hypothetical protein